MRGFGLCQTHLYRERTNGSPQAVRLVIGNPEERFWARINKNGPIPAHRPDLGPCWVWTGRLKREGYGTMSIRNRPVYVHRFAYELLVEVIPVGLQIDHLCRNPACANPTHLEPVTSRVNTIRGDNPRLTRERLTGIPLAEDHRHRAAAARKVASVDKVSRECERCGRTFTGWQGLGVHNALVHNEHAPRWPRNQRTISTSSVTSPSR